MELQPGTIGEVEITVRPEQTADALGNPGVQVLATPFLVSLLEDAAGRAVRPHLPPGAATVGTTLEIKHMAATPVGMKVRARATLLETDGRRFLFKVEAHDEVEQVAEGRHERFLVQNLEKFLDRAMKKSAKKET